MQDGFVADAGDFGKYGLLRVLCNLTGSSGPRLKLGVVWYYVDGDARGEKKYSKHRQCDPKLYARLQTIYNGRRTVASVEKSKILGKDTLFYQRPLNLKHSGRDSRLNDRARWLEEALKKTNGCRVVFLDPDNGLNPTSVKKHHKDAPFFVFLDEIESFVKSGSTVILYDQTKHRSTAEEQISATLRKLHKIARHGTKPFAVRYHVGTSRAYFVLPTKRDQSMLRRRAEKMVLGKWKGAFDQTTYSLE